jgi:hypothetical protein
MDINGDVVMGAQGVLMPPSPSFPNGVFEQEQAAPTSPGLTIFKAKLRVVPQDRTGAGVKKSKTKSKATFGKLVDSNAGAAAALIQEAVQTSFRFMELPGGKSVQVQSAMHVLTISRNSEPDIPSRPLVPEAGFACSPSAHGIPAASHPS